MVEREGALTLLSGTASMVLADKISQSLGVATAEADVGRFSSGEIRVRIMESVRGSDVFIVQSTSAPVNDNLMEVLLLADAARRASAHRVTAVLPFLAYSRQDRINQSREPISAKLVANLIAEAGASRMLTVDLHTPQLQGFYDIPVDNLRAGKILGSALLEKKIANLIVVSPDSGGVHRARQMAQLLGTPLGFVDKRRSEPGVSEEIVNVIGKVRGKTVLLLDDLIDTGRTMERAVEALWDFGAEKVYIAATHAIFSDQAATRLDRLGVEQVIVTDTIEVTQPPQRHHSLSVAPMLAEAIMRIHENLSISRMFESTERDAP